MIGADFLLVGEKIAAIPSRIYMPQIFVHRQYVLADFLLDRWRAYMMYVYSGRGALGNPKPTTFLSSLMTYICNGGRQIPHLFPAASVYVQQFFAERRTPIIDLEKLNGFGRPAARDVFLFFSLEQYFHMKEISV